MQTGWVIFAVWKETYSEITSVGMECFWLPVWNKMQQTNSWPYQRVAFLWSQIFTSAKTAALCSDITSFFSYCIHFEVTMLLWKANFSVIIHCAFGWNMCFPEKYFSSVEASFFDGNLFCRGISRQLSPWWQMELQCLNLAPRCRNAKPKLLHHIFGYSSKCSRCWIFTAQDWRLRQSWRQSWLSDDLLLKELVKHAHYFTVILLP